MNLFYKELIKKAIPSNVFTALLVALVSGLFTLGAVGVTTYFNQKSDTDRLRHASSMVLVEKRLDLIERLSGLIGEKPAVQVVWSKLNKDPDSLELNEKLAKYNSEFTTVLQLSSFMFGSGTKKSIADLDTATTGLFWEKDSQLYLDILNSMVWEINYGFDL